MQKSTDELGKREKHTQWKKIIATVKKNFGEKVVTNSIEKKTKVLKFTVDRIKLFDASFEQGVKKEGIGIAENVKSK